MAKKMVVTGKVIQRRDPCDLNVITDSDQFSWSIHNIVSSLLKDRYVQIILILTIVGFFLRFYHIGFNSLWLDEAVTYHFASLPIADLWNSLETGAEFNPPLFYLIESFMLVFGNSEAILRTVPALAGTFLIPVFYLLGKEFKDRNCGLVCATLATFSVFLIYYSQEARAYTLALLFLSLSILFFLRALKNNLVYDWILCGLFSGLALWTHFYSVVTYGVLILFGLYYIITDTHARKEKIKNLGLSVSSFLLVTLPLLIVTIDLFSKRTAESPTFGLSGLVALIHALPFLAGGDLFLTIVLSVLFCIGITWCVLKEKRKAVFLIIGIVTILAVSYFISFRMPFELRFFYIMVPFFFLGIAYSVKLFCHIFKNRAVIVILIIGIALLSFPLISATYSVYTKENWRDFSREFENYTNDGDLVILMPSYMHYPFNYYYNPLIDNTTQAGASNIKELEKTIHDNQDKRIFIIVTRDILAADPSGDSITWLKKNSQFLTEYTGIYLYQINKNQD